MTTAKTVVVYRSTRVDAMYLYVDAREGMARVPSELMTRFGHPVEAMTLELDAERKLARTSAPDVLNAIALRGFYLQMPPSPEYSRRDQ